MASDRYSIDAYVVTRQVMLDPHRGVLYGDVFYQYVLALNNSNHVWADLVWSFEGRALAVDCAAACYGDALQLFSVNQALVCVVIRVGPEGLHGRGEVFEVGAAQKGGACIEPERDVAFHVDCAGEESAGREIDGPAALFGAYVDCFLNGFGAQSFAVRFGAVVTNVVDIIRAEDRSCREEAQERY